MQQMAIDLQDRTDPPTCQHRVPTGLDGISQCAAHDMTFVDCMKSVCGEPPKCCYEPLDNSAEAVERRLEWMRRHKKGGDECETDL